MTAYDDLLRAAIDSTDEPLIASVLAAKIVAQTQETQPAILDEWLAENAVIFTTQRIGILLRSERGKAISGRNATRFGKASSAFDDGDDTAFTSILDVHYEVSEDHAQLRLREMRKPHLIFAADQYDGRAKANAMRAAFLRAIAKKVGAKTVGDAMTDEQLHRLWGSLGGDE